MRTITLRLPWPPSVNHYYGRMKNGRVYLKEAGRLYRRQAAAEFARLGWPRITGSVAVHLLISQPNRLRRDIDNLRKAVYDAISDRKQRGTVIHTGIIPDDANIKQDSAEFVEGEPGIIEVCIREI